MAADRGEVDAGGVSVDRAADTVVTLTKGFRVSQSDRKSIEGEVRDLHAQLDDAIVRLNNALEVERQAKLAVLKEIEGDDAKPS